jgi:hypothetical protein
MITRTFAFTADAHGRTDFRIAYETFRGRDPTKIEKGERPLLAAIQRALEAVSVPMGDLPEDAELDLRMRTLRPEGGTITLSQRAFEKLTTYAESTPFQAGVSAQVEDFLDRWSAAEKHEPETAP